MKFIKSPFICPVCHLPLTECSDSLKCRNGHSFDFARQGYINLLMKNSSGAHHGDDRLMVDARRRFLGKGYYKPLRDMVSNYAGKECRILDAGCGEGYYTSLFAENNYVCGIDISKDAVKAASGKYKTADFAVASLSDIPLSDASMDKVINIFAPDCSSEFFRVLKPGGSLVTVIPMENHLKELKEAVYDVPYLNPPVKTEKENFILYRSDILRYEITLTSASDIKSLFLMTPYYYKTGKKDQEKLEKLNNLTTQLEFFIAEYKKIN